MEKWCFSVTATLSASSQAITELDFMEKSNYSIVLKLNIVVWNYVIELRKVQGKNVEKIKAFSSKRRSPDFILAEVILPGKGFIYFVS